MSQFVNANGNTLLNLKFSLKEQETGMQWIDGKKIYCKVILVSGFDSKDKYVQHNISDLYRVLSCDLFMKTSDGTNHMIPRAHQDEDHDGISIQITKTNLILQVGQSNGFADATGYAILKYIKYDFNQWLKAAGIRAIKTVAQTAVALIGTSTVMNEVNWAMIISASCLSGVVSILTSVAGLPELEEIVDES